MKILHVIPGLTMERGGPSTVVAALARHQADLGHEVTVLATDQGLRRGERPMPLDPRVHFHRARTLGPGRIAYAPRFRRWVRKLLRAADVVHVHSIFTYPVHATLREAVRTGTPVLLRPCGLLHGYSLGRSRRVKAFYLNRWGELVCRAVTAWHFTSREEQQGSWPGQAVPGIRQPPASRGAPRRSVVVPNGIEPGDFAVEPAAARAAVRGRWPAIGDGPYAVFLGRLHAKKRLDLLLEAFLQGAPASARLVVAGPDEQGWWPELTERYLLAGGAASRVVRLGAVEGAAKAELLSAAEFYALPSEHENFGVAALESLAAGTPALLSPHVDLAGLFEDGPITTVPLDPWAWGAAIGRAFAQPYTREQRRDLQCSVAARFGWRRIAERLVRGYEWVLAGCTGPPPE